MLDGIGGERHFTFAGDRPVTDVLHVVEQTLGQDRLAQPLVIERLLKGDIERRALCPAPGNNRNRVAANIAQTSTLMTDFLRCRRSTFVHPNCGERVEHCKLVILGFFGGHFAPHVGVAAATVRPFIARGMFSRKPPHSKAPLEQVLSG